jgi:hypothetical protein
MKRFIYSTSHRAVSNVSCLPFFCGVVEGLLESNTAVASLASTAFNRWESADFEMPSASASVANSVRRGVS